MRSTNPIAVGDTVVFERNSEDAGTIEKIQERKNFIARKSVNLSKESHIVASNLDRAFLIVTIASPRTSSGFIDRFLVTAEAYGIPTTIVFNKIDLLESDAEGAERQNELQAIYSDAGYHTMKVSAKTGQGIYEFVSLNEGINRYGVGKSTSLMNSSGLDLKTEEVSISFKGKHTTI